MRFLSVLLLTAAAATAANVDFATGQAARLFIGQTQATRQEPGASQTLLGGLSGVAYANDMLFVADASRVGSGPNNNRVLIYKNVSSKLPRPTDELQYTQRCPICVGEADIVLGQPDFTTTDRGKGPSGMRLPTAVASDGNIVVVADTENNRVLIWKSIPTANGQPADLVLGQKDFNSTGTANIPTASIMRGPQGVWIQNGRLYVADTQFHRVLVWNSIPSQNGAPADLVLGQPNFTTFVESDLLQQDLHPTASTLLNPVAVTSDGTRLFIADLGYNRVLIWNSIPNSNGAPADVVVGQPDMTSALPNHSYTQDSSGNKTQVLCESNGTDADGKPTFPAFCAATLSFPRFALSDGQRLFIADGGNDRLLVFDNVPTANGQAADKIIGQLGGNINQASDAADRIVSPMSLAWDGVNLFAGDTYNRRINVYSMGETSIPYTGVRNAASFEIYAVGGVGFSGKAVEGESVTIKIADKEYTHKIVKDEDIFGVMSAMVNLINAGDGDPNAFATPNPATISLILTARAPGSDGNNVAYSAETKAVKASDTASIAATTAGATLSGGQDAARIAPGTIVSIVGENLSDGIESAPEGTSKDTLADTQVYLDGVRVPLIFVSPTLINAQVPFEFLDTTSINAYVRTIRKDNTVSVTTPVAVTIVPQNPGVFTQGGQDPRPAVASHFSSYATGTVSVDGTAKTGDIATVTIEDRSYTYTVKDGDTLDNIRDGLIELINADPKVQAFAAGVFDRIRIQARIAGPAGNGIPFTAKAPDGSAVILSPTNVALCCANVAGAPVTADNPALPGETIVVLATGLGLPEDSMLGQIVTGESWPAGVVSRPKAFVSALAGGKTANVLYAGLKPGMVGVWEVHLELNTDLPTNPVTQATIAQDVYVSNIFTFPLVNPDPALDTATTTP